MGCRFGWKWAWTGEVMDGRNTGVMDGEKDVRRDIRRREIEIDTDWRLAECMD